MAVPRYALDEFIHDMTDLVATQPDQATLFDRGSRLIERLVRDPESVPLEYRRPSMGGRRPGGGSYLLHRGPGLSVTSVVWGPGSRTSMSARVEPVSSRCASVAAAISRGIVVSDRLSGS